MLEGAQDQQGGQDIPSAVALMKLRPKAEDWLGYRMVIQHWDLTISQCAEKNMKADDFQELKKAVREGMQQIHEALSPEQRNRFADLVEFGPRRMHGGGCGHARFGHHHHHGYRPAGGEPSTVNL